MHVYLIYGAALALAIGLPLAWKWQLGVVRAGMYMLAIAMLAAVVLTPADRWLALNAFTGTLAMCGVTVLAAAAGLLVVFFRDPDRRVPARQDVIVSPADGLVIYTATRPGELPLAEKNGRTCRLSELAGTALGEGRAMAIGISMNLADVHVNRAPVGGRVRLVEHVMGTFGSLRNPDSVLTNERVTTVIEAGDLQIAIVQIASRLVRRIVTFVSQDEVLNLGQRIGAIRFGSQVDLLIPANPQIQVAVQTGDRVVAGQTIMALITAGRDSAATAGPAGRADRPGP